MKYTVDVRVMVESHGSYVVEANSEHEAEQKVLKLIGQNVVPDNIEKVEFPQIDKPIGGTLIDGIYPEDEQEEDE